MRMGKLQSECMVREDSSGKFRTNKKYKDRLFIRIFQEKKELLKLYNAVNHSEFIPIWMT